MRELVIGEKRVGWEVQPFIVAEMSGNHNQSLARALELVGAAAKSGAHALKLQTYTADTITLNAETPDFYISDAKSQWNGTKLYDLYQKAHTPWQWHKPIMDKCKELGIICFSTPFDETAVDFLETLNVPCYKIASFENVHLPLIKKVAQTGKPIIMSTGMASVAELDDAVKTARGNGCKDLILLKCTSSYPAEPSQSNILTIPHMQKLFDCQVGLSDHTLGIGVSVASVALGATFIEKHFTLNRADGGVDSTFSLEPEEMKNLVIETKRAWQALGDVCYKPSGAEEKSLQFRQSLYVAQDMKSGDIFTQENLRIVRPGLGLSPKYYDEFLGKKISRDLKKGTPVKWDAII